MRRWQLITGSLLLTILFYFFWWHNPLLAYFDYKLYDRLSHISPSEHTPNSTVVIEIDDKSLKVLGQWPWPRMITAKLIETINRSNPSAIVLDMVFAEEDRTSPVALKSFYQTVLDENISIMGLPKSLQDNDAILADIMGHSPMILPVFSNSDIQSGACILPDSVTYNRDLQKSVLYPLDALVCNLPRFQKRSHGVGHIHAAADADGILRRLSLVMRHQDVWIPTLGMAAVASVKGGLYFDKTSPLFGGMKLDMNGNRFFTNRDSSALLYFYPSDRYEKISAIDILNGTIDPERLSGKYIFIGSTALGLDSTYTMSDGSVRSGVYVHATMVENALNGDLAVQPSLYQPINIAISFFIGLIFLIQMIRKHYLSVVILFFIVMVISTGLTYVAWHYHMYLSIGYLILPLSSYLFILAVLMFFIDYHNKKQFIDALQRSTEQKERLKSALSQSEIEIEYQKAMLLQQSKLAAMGEMIDNIAHQWRQPLNLLGVIIQHAEFAYAKGKVDGEYIHKLSTDSMEQILFMSQTIEDFRNFVKPDRKNIPFDIHHSVYESLQLLDGILRLNNIETEVNDHSSPVIVMGSPGEFKQVMINLLQNSRDALFENNTTNPKITIGIDADEINAVVTVSDNGGGISPKIIKQIFEPYFTTKEEGKGSGIGLYISTAIIQSKMGGRIDVTSIKNRTIFTISLPLWHDK